MAKSIEHVLRDARAAFARRLSSISSNDWGRPTPCSEWTIRQLVNHVVGQEYRMGLLLRGGGLERFIAIREDDFLGDDPAAAWDRGCAELDGVMREPEALERIVEYRTGPIIGRDLVAVCVFEMIIHTWDLAHSLRVDEDLDDGLAAWALEELKGPLRFLAVAFEHVELPPGDVTNQERLLATCGRSAAGLPWART